ncbi:hypothetical protein V6N13_099320 [Hibiscus sabdariffa]
MALGSGVVVMLVKGVNIYERNDEGWRWWFSQLVTVAEAMCDGEVLRRGSRSMEEWCSDGFSSKESQHGV